MTKQTATVGDLLARLRKDPAWSTTQAQEAQRREEVRRELRRHEQALVSDLRAAGFAVDSVWDLVNTVAPYPGAIPVLLAHLPMTDHPRVLEGIVRALSVKEAKDDAWEPLLRQFEAHASPEAISAPGLADALANALSVVAGREKASDLLRLSQDPRYGSARIFFLDALGRIGDDTALPVLAQLEYDGELGSHARRASARIRRRSRKRR